MRALRNDSFEIVQCLNCNNYTNKKDFYKHYTICTLKQEESVILNSSNSKSIINNNINQERTDGNRKKDIAYNNFDDFLEKNKNFSKKETPIYKKCQDCKEYIELPYYNSHINDCISIKYEKASNEVFNREIFEDEEDKKDFVYKSISNDIPDGVVFKQNYNNRKNNIVNASQSNNIFLPKYKKCEFCAGYFLINFYEHHLITEHLEETRYIYNTSKYFYELKEDIFEKIKRLQDDLPSATFIIMNFYFLKEILKESYSNISINEVDDKLSTFKGIIDALKKINYETRKNKFEKSLMTNDMRNKGKLSVFYDLENNSFDYYFINYFEELKCIYVLCNKNNAESEGYTKMIGNSINLDFQSEENLDLPELIKEYKLQFKREIHYLYNYKNLILLTDLLLNNLPHLIKNISVELFNKKLSCILNDDLIFEEIMNFSFQFKINFLNRVNFDSTNNSRFEEYNTFKINGRIMNSNSHSNSIRSSRISRSSFDDHELMSIQGFDFTAVVGLNTLSRVICLDTIGDIFDHITRNIVNIPYTNEEELISENLPFEDIDEDIDDDNFSLLSIGSMGISKEQLAKYLIKESSSKMLNKEDKIKIDNDDCFICYEKFKNSKLIKMPCCRNIMHYDCGVKWFIYEKKSECPLCKKDLMEIS